jgi:hypothetical protein
MRSARLRQPVHVIATVAVDRDSLALHDGNQQIERIAVGKNALQVRQPSDRC